MTPLLSFVLQKRETISLGRFQNDEGIMAVNHSAASAPPTSSHFQLVSAGFAFAAGLKTASCWLRVSSVFHRRVAFAAASRPRLGCKSLASTVGLLSLQPQDRVLAANRQTRLAKQQIRN